MQCTVKYITSSAILVLPLLLLFLPTLISSLSRRDCLPTLTGTFDNHIIGMCLLCLYEVSIYEIFLRGRARTLYTYSRGDFALRVVHHHHPHHNFEIHLQFYLYENEQLQVYFILLFLPASLGSRAGLTIKFLLLLLLQKQFSYFTKKTSQTQLYT